MSASVPPRAPRMQPAVFLGIVHARAERADREKGLSGPAPTPQALPAAPQHPPADCVREFPTLSPDTVELVAFDWEGKPRFRTEVPRSEDLASWHLLLLRRTRRLFPRRGLELIG